MLAARLLALLGLAGYAGAFRIVKKSGKGKSLSVECTLEFISVVMEPDALADNLAGPELAECTALDGTVYNIIADDVDQFEPGDFVSLQLKQEGQVIGLQTPLYRAVSGTFLHAAEAGPSIAGAGFNMVAIRAVYSDAAPRDTTTIRNNLNSVRNRWSNISYGTFKPPATVVTLKMPGTWETARQNCATMRSSILERLGNASSYVYLMLFLPTGKPCPNFRGISGVALQGCGRLDRSPRYGSCWSMYWNDKTFVQAHELGHNLGLHHNGRTVNGNYRDYADPIGYMGASYSTQALYHLPDRFQIGWVGSKEVLTPSSNRKYTLNRLETLAKGTLAGLKLPCSACQPDNGKATGGNVFVSFARGQVYVHLSRLNFAGTEVMQVLGARNTWQNRFARQAVRVCSIGTGRAVIAYADSLSKAVC